MPVRRTKSVGTTLTEAEYATLEALATAQPMSASVRAVLLEAAAAAVRMCSSPSGSRGARVNGDRADPAIALPFEHGARRRTRVPSLRFGGIGRP